LFKDEGTRSLAEHLASSRFVEWARPGLWRLVRILGELVPQRSVHRLDRVDSGPGRPSDHHVGKIAGHDMKCLGQGQIPGSLIKCDRVARTSGIRMNANVASGHIR